jgi:hypothetical protein
VERIILKTGRGHVYWIHLARNRDQLWGSCQWRNETVSTWKARNIFSRWATVSLWTILVKELNRRLRSGEDQQQLLADPNRWHHCKAAVSQFASHPVVTQFSVANHEMSLRLHSMTCS